MTTLKAWIGAARLRTLPLSVAGILAAAAIAIYSDVFNARIFGLSIFTTLGFQILSNLANDYGDGIKGTDNSERIGPARAMQSGALSATALKKGIWVTALITLLSAVVLIYLAFGKENLVLSLVYLFLGIAAITAAIKYTVGSNAYGYKALGDLFVFLFFGLVSVLGGFFLYKQELILEVILPALTVGFWSVAVLHLNNMRDRSSDLKSGKITIAIKLGPKTSKKYHYMLLVTGAFAALVFAWLTATGWMGYLPLLAFIPLALHAKTVALNKDQQLLDPELKKVALSTFLYGLLLLVVQTL